MNSKIIFFLFIWSITVSCTPWADRKQASVVFYNVENLFDTIDDPHVNDNEFLPDSKKEWTTERYQKKLNDIAKVLTGINPADLPEVIGLCEVENLSVLQDLVNTPAMAKGKYRIVHHDSRDARGIDVALLYRPAEFKLISSEAIDLDAGFRTRDILHVHGKFGADEIHFFVNHWPSRVGGAEESEPRRIAVAQVLKNKVDELLDQNPSSKIIIMGDMNDEPDNPSLLQTLGAKAPGNGGNLVNLMFPLYEQNQGSYKYRGDWNMLDQLIVTNPLLDGKGFVTIVPGNIYQDEWMLYVNRNGEISPNRTYSGSTYTGGVSDHFPVYLKLSR